MIVVVNCQWTQNWSTPRDAKHRKRDQSRTCLVAVDSYHFTIHIVHLAKKEINKTINTKICCKDELKAHEFYIQLFLNEGNEIPQNWRKVHK